MAEKNYTSQNGLNQAVLMGRLARDPEVRYTQGENSFAVARFTICVPKISTKEGGDANFISCVCYRGKAEFVEKYLRKGTKVSVVGSIETGSYTNKDGQKVYTTEVSVSDLFFCESKNASAPSSAPAVPSAGDGFMNIPDGIEEELPFN